MNAYVNNLVLTPVITKSVKGASELDRQLICTNLNLKIFHMNIRSINKNFDSLIILLAQIRHELNILILTETLQLIDPY